MLIIANPGGGRGRTLKRMPHFTSLLDEANEDYQVRWTEAPKHATEIATEEMEKFDLVVAFGGDGTVNEIANGLIGSDTPLGIIPLGTGNDFARSCGIPLRIEEAARLLVKGVRKEIDVGTVNGRFFTNVVGVGFDARVNRESLKTAWLKGTALFLWATLKTLAKYESIPMRIELDNEVIEETTYLLCVGNGWSVGAGLKLTPDALLDDGTFDVCHVSDISSMKVVMNFPKLFNGNINDIDEVTSHRSRRIDIQSEVPFPVHIDGEIPDGETTDLHIEIIPKGLSVIGNWHQAGQGINAE
ncbi:MAG: diacylglycerol kinase family protein [Candidatus Neomarinimicrobiota bacterium]